MYTSSLINILSLAASISAVAIDRRDGPKDGPSNADILAIYKNPNLPVQKAMKVEEIKPLVDPQAKRIRITYGPYKIKAANSKENVGNGISMDPHGTGYSCQAGDDFPRDVTVLDTKSDIVNEQYKRADLAEGLYNHHNLFSNMSHKLAPIISCGGQAKASVNVAILMAGATEVGSIRFSANKDAKFKSGFYVGKSDQIMIGIDMVNYRNEDRTIYSVSEVEYLPGRSSGLLPAEQTTIDIGACGGDRGDAFHAPTGQTKFSLVGKDITMAQDGYLIHMRGHLHDGGKDMEIMINGKQVCNSKAIYGGEGHEGIGPDGKPWATVFSTTLCPEDIPVKQGDKLTIKANYDTEAHPQRESAHGEMAEGMALFAGTWVSGKA